MGNKIENMPNIIVWSWMRDALKLKATELMIFAHIFSSTFDGAHYCYTTLDSMEDWFGVTRQTISRMIDKMVDNKYILKITLKDKKNNAIKHNKYCVNLPFVTKVCEDSDYNCYSNFVMSYKQLFINRFPDDSIRIEEYFARFLDWHKAKNEIVNIKLTDLCKKLVNSSNINEDIEKLINNTDYSYNNTRIKSNSSKKSDTAPKTNANYVDDAVKNVKKTKKNKKIKKMSEMNHEFALMYAENNLELIELLDKVVTNGKGSSYNEDQWAEQLYDLRTICKTTSKMIESVRNSYKNGYRAIVYRDRSLVDIDEKQCEINSFTDDVRLRDILSLYIEETPHGKSCTVGQFKFMLRKLAEADMTVENMVECVGNAYANGWKAFVYNTTNNNVSIDANKDEKIALIDKFIKDGYYQNTGNLRDLLVQYATTTKSGIAMTVEMLDINLKQLRLNCCDDNKKISSVMNAISGNWKSLSFEDFSETKQLKAHGTSREYLADSMDRQRKQKFETTNKSTGHSWKDNMNRAKMRGDM